MKNLAKHFPFELEAYWGTSEGVLMHGTITVFAKSVAMALGKARSMRLAPSDPRDHFSSCARNEYFEDHYDVDSLGKTDE